MKEKPSDWTIEDSNILYNVSNWGHPYFSINQQGNVVVSPKGAQGGSLDLLDLVESLKKRSISLPILLHFPDILQDRINLLNGAFAKAIERYNYQGSYRGLFPIKVSNQRHFVESLTEFGAEHHLGLEAGSKPELIIAISSLKAENSFLVCNGYKDREYMETAILAARLGKNVLIVLEQLDEVRLAIQTAKDLNIKPRFGFRVKLTTKGQGHWKNTAGDRAKFGMSSIEIVEGVQLLKQAGFLDCLCMLHFHIGSQISSIIAIKQALREASRIYVELTKLGAPMEFLDAGGGLAVDYDGSKSSFYASKNYNIQSYANDVVAEVNDACSMAGIKVPTLMTESGRAIASHQAILVFDVLGTNAIEPKEPNSPEENSHYIIKTLYEIYSGIAGDNVQESYNDIEQFKAEAATAFRHGLLTLKDKAYADSIYWAACQKIHRMTKDLPNKPDDIEALDRVLSAIYYVNMSVFQSAPDAWAINQLFPVVPIHRLNEEPTERATLADLTCDSDGRIDNFISLTEDVKHILEVHPLVFAEASSEVKESSSQGHRRLSHKPYYLGMFLVGAYQEIMGNLHNLFGDTNAVHIRLTDNGGYQVQYLVKGDTAKEVLGYVQYSESDIIEKMRQQCEIALSENRITLEESQHLLSNFERSLNKYTYLS